MTYQTNDFNPFEAKLEAAFRPVHPSNLYVQSIRQRITSKAPVEVAQRLEDPTALLLILAGVLSVSLLIITVARAFFYLTNRSKA
jgi:hypothetical protein